MEFGHDTTSHNHQRRRGGVWVSFYIQACAEGGGGVWGVRLAVPRVSPLRAAVYVQICMKLKVALSGICIGGATCRDL